MCPPVLLAYNVDLQVSRCTLYFVWLLKFRNIAAVHAMQHLHFPYLCISYLRMPGRNNNNMIRYRNMWFIIFPPARCH